MKSVNSHKIQSTGIIPPTQFTIPFIYNNKYLLHVEETNKHSILQ